MALKEGGDHLLEGLEDTPLGGLGSALVSLRHPNHSLVEQILERLVADLLFPRLEACLWQLPLSLHRNSIEINYCSPIGL